MVLTTTLFATLAVIVGKAKAAVIAAKVLSLVKTHGTFHAAHPHICAVLHRACGGGAKAGCVRALTALTRLFR